MELKWLKKLAVFVLTLCVVFVTAVGDVAYAATGNQYENVSKSGSQEIQGNNGNHYGNDKGNGNKKVNDEGNNGNHYGQKKHAGVTEKYTVSFDVTNAWKNFDISLPETVEVEEGTTIDDLKIATLEHYVFGGWYYDAEGTKVAASTDEITANTTLYARMIEIETPAIEETPVFDVVNLGVDDYSEFTFRVRGYEEGCIESFVDSVGDEPVDFSVNGDLVVPKLAKGCSYIVTLSDKTDAVFVINGEEKEDTVDILYILTDKEAVNNLKLADLTFLEISEVSDLSGLVFEGLYTISVNQNGESYTSENRKEGSFTYENGNLEIGETIAIYEGLSPDLRDFDTIGTEGDGGIAYVTITGREGNSYSFESASAKDVIFFPDVLPVPVTADKDGNLSNNSAIISKGTLSYSGADFAKMNLSEDTTIDEGDFIAFYEGGLKNGNLVSLAEIINVSEDGEDYYIDFLPASEEDIVTSMDVYNTRTLDLSISDEKAKEVCAAIEQDAYDSGFLDETAEYLTALAFETNGFKELSDDLDFDLKSYEVTFADGTPVDDETFMELCAEKKKVSIKDKNARANIFDETLTHFEGKEGKVVELVASFTILIGEDKDDKHMEIHFEASFKQELMFDIHTTGHAIEGDTWIFPSISDYVMTAHIDVGTFACVGLTATAKTVEEKEPEFDWKNITGTDAEQGIIDIGKQITELIDEKKCFFNEKLVDEDGEEIERYDNGGDLATKYANFIEKSDASWVKLIEEEVFETTGYADGLALLQYQFKAEFIVAVDLYVTIGATAEMGAAKRYQFSFWMRSDKCSNNVIDTETPYIQADVYVFGTAGFKIGLEFTFAVGLLNVNLDSIGMTAEVGFYIQLWGYFYLRLYKEMKQDSQLEMSGAILFEVGVYLDMHFVAQLFSSDDLKWEPTLYENKWPIRRIGESQNVTDFAIEEDNPCYKMDVPAGIREVTIPKTFFDMKFLELREGEEGVDCYDDFFESRYDISVSNKDFSYNPLLNKVFVFVPQDTKDDVTCEITFTWKGCQAAFNSFPIQRTITINWINPDKDRYINFNTMGGNYIEPIVAKSGKKIYAPEDPVREGYTFEGWYEDSDYTTPYTIPSKMPSITDAAGMILYAKWKPIPYAEYTVYYYKLQPTDDGVDSYGLEETRTFTGVVGEVPEIASIGTDYPGYALSSSNVLPIKADGTTKIRLFYSKETYQIRFTYGELYHGLFSRMPIIKKGFYGQTVSVPTISVTGYIFDGFEGLETDENGCVVITGNATYEARWKLPEASYKVEYYTENAEDDGYILERADYLTGPIGEEVTAEICPFMFFEFDENNENNVLSGEVTEDGSLVLKVYYKRDRVNVYFDANGGTLGASGDCKEYKMFQSFVYDEPTREGYRFVGWYKDGKPFTDINISEEVTLVAQWEKMAYQVNYVVEHYRMDVNGNYSDAPDMVESFLGMEGDEIYLYNLINEDMEEVGHFFYTDAYIDGEVAYEAEISSDLVIKLYYERAQYNVNWNFNGGEPVDDNYTHGLCYYGAPIILPNLVKEGCTLMGLFAPATVPDYDITIDAIWLVPFGE